MGQNRQTISTRNADLHHQRPGALHEKVQQHLSQFIPVMPVWNLVLYQVRTVNGIILIKFRGCFNPLMVFRQRPHPTDPNKMFYDVQNYSMMPAGTEWPERPPHRQWKHGEDTLGEVLDQDASNLPMVQRGMNSTGFRGLWISSQELRIRHFHKTIDDYLHRQPIKWMT